MTKNIRLELARLISDHPEKDVLFYCENSINIPYGELSSVSLHDIVKIDDKVYLKSDDDDVIKELVEESLEDDGKFDDINDDEKDRLTAEAINNLNWEEAIFVLLKSE